MAIEFSLSTSDLFLIPDISALVMFSNGDLGISDQVRISTIVKNISKLKSDDQLNQFKTTAGFSLNNSNDTYFKNGMYSVTSNDIILNTSNNLTGLSAMEKALIQSIFESQKPYADIFIQTVGCIIEIEDIISRILSIGGNSLKPIYNPKALGYIPPNGISPLNQGLSKLNSLNSINRGSGNTQSNNSNLQVSNPLNPSDQSPGYSYEVESIVYSTGIFDPTVKYKYEYIDIFDDTITENNLSNNGVNILNIDNTNAEPNTIVFGIFDSKGTPLSKSPDWLENSGKWFGQFNMVNDFKYIWTNPLFADKISFSSPGKGWSLKKDISGSPIIIINSNSDDLNTITSYYSNLIQNNLNQSNLSQQDRSNITDQVNQVLLSGTQSMYEVQLDTLLSFGFLPTLQLVNKEKSPIGPYPFLPKEIIWNGTSSIPPSSSSQHIWIDPENEYDMKIIEVIPIFNSEKAINTQLSINTPYSNGYYGSSDSTNKQNIDTIFRYTNSIEDIEVYYIVEGVLSSNNTQSFPTIENGSKVNGSKYYKFPKGPISAIGAFIKMLINIFSKLIPLIVSLEEIFLNPASFIVNNIILKKLGDNNGTEGIKYDMFSQNFLKDFNTLLTLNPSERKNYVNNSKLKNYVYVSDDNSYKFLLDGGSSIEFLSFVFGIDLVNLNPSLTSNKKSNNQPILEFILNLVAFPLNIIKGVVEYILKFFKSLTNPFSLPKDIVDFISFKWILDFFDPLSLLELLGITFDIIKFGQWISSIDSYPDNHLFDLSEIISIPFVPKLFTATKQQILNLKKTPMDMLSSIICLIGDIINAFIDFIWALMGLKPILKPPHVTLCKDTNTSIINSQTLPSNQILGTYSSSISSQLYPPQPLSSQQALSYVYNITLPDGTILTDLTYDQLQSYLNQNKSIDFEFDF